MAVVPNLIVSISGEPKSGKTHLALSFPKPLLVFSLDIGVERVLPHYQDELDLITVQTYPLPILDTVRPKPYAQPIWADITKDYREALESDKYETIVVDTATALWEVARHAYTEELKQKNLLPVQYGEVNARMSALLTQPRFSGKNLVLTHYLRDRYVNDANTGEQELDGYKRTEGLVDIVIRIERKKVGNKTIMRSVITDCGYDRDLCGHTADDMTYQDLLDVLGFGVE